jgi:hypothetical protein
MDPRLQAGLELQLEKQSQQEYDSSLSGVLGQHFKHADNIVNEERVTDMAENVTKNIKPNLGSLLLTQSDALVKLLKKVGQSEWGLKRRGSGEGVAVNSSEVSKKEK